MAACKLAQIFSSDLQRAARTAEAICVAQLQSALSPREVTKLEILREQDFGFYEGKKFIERAADSHKSGKEEHADVHRNDAGFRDVESKDAMRVRMDTFIDERLIRLLVETGDDHSVAVVAHGIILSHLWRGILRRFRPGNVSVMPGVSTRGMSLEYLGGWSNTGYLDLKIKPIDVVLPNTSAVGGSHDEASGDLLRDPAALTVTGDFSLESRDTITQSSSNPFPATSQPTLSKSPLLDMSLAVQAVNSQEHLKGLKKTRGGIGSLKHDSKQKTMDSFFNRKRKLDE